MMKLSPKTRSYFLAVIILLVFNPMSRAYSASLGAVPSLSLSESWDSNIFNASQDEESDFIFRATPSLDFFLSAFYTTLRFGGSLEVEQFAKHSELNNTSNAITRNLNLAVEKSRPLQITPLFTIAPSVRYVETHDMVRRNQLTGSTTPGLPPSETAVTSRIGVREYGGGVTMGYTFTQRFTFELGGAGYRREFTDSTPGLVDSKIYSLHSAVTRTITPRFSSGIFFDVADNRYDSGSESRTYTTGLTGSYVLTEHHNVFFGVGATNTQDYDVNGNSTKQGWSPYGSLSLSYNWKSFVADLSVSYQIAGGGSFGTTTRRGSGSLNLSDSFTERWSWLLSGSYQRNSSFADASPVDPSAVETVSGTAKIVYSPAPWASFELNGNHFQQWSNNTLDFRRSAISLIFRTGITIGKIIPYGISN